MTTRRHDVLPSPGFADDDSAPASNLSSMQRAIVTIQKLRGKLEILERARTEPIAIIGMACRFPGGANTPEAFFRLLEEGVDTVTEVPPDRWHIERESAESEGEQRSLRWGAFLKDVDRFDAAFFGISPREAESLDPQQRLLLEVSWEALERAGQLPERLMGSKTGVFVGIWSLDYQQRVIGLSQDKLDAYCFTGNVLSTAAGRLAYTMGLQGPCMSVETACSSSLTATHLACQSLRMGECALALAGGVNLMLSPTTTKLLSKTQALSPDGRCKSFDARANGFVRGEGCGMLVLKRLSDAERDGDTILALIRGSAVNQDGRSTGLTAPNVLSQQTLLRQALENARLAPQDIGYVETHGTGTSLGDPIEMEAIKAVLGAPREKGTTCILGAVKTNIGHLEAAAGVAGLMKVVLSLQNEKIPGNLHFRSLNPRIDLKGTSLEIARESMPWAAGVRPRYAGVSAFGISGTNAHIIIEEAPRNLEEGLLEEDTTTYLLPISAKTPEALQERARAFRETLVSTDLRLLDIVHTASARRSHYVHRLSAVGRTKDELAAQLAVYLDGQMSTGVAQGQSAPARAKVVFVFSGQGSQWLGMGRQLYETDASFRSVVDTCDNLMTARLGWSILDELDTTEATSRMTDTHVAQPLLFAVQIALVEMLRSWGISPDAMIGHSVGEVAAAHIAGILSLDEAIRLVALRGRIMQKATGMGKMVSVTMTPEAAKDIIAGYEDRVAIAAINDPESVVLSGEANAVDDVIARCDKQGVVSRLLRVNYAFHSPQMDVLERELVERLVRVDARRATLAMYSTVLADCVDGKELDVHYWGRNIRRTVDFAGAVFAAIRDGYQLFLEVGPHPELVGNVKRCFAAKRTDGFAVGTLKQNLEDRRAMLSAAGALYTRGCSIEWMRVVPNGGRCVPLPTSPWQRERFWVDVPQPSSLSSPGRYQSLAETAAPRPQIVFIFSGQGSQWVGMGKMLLAEEPPFRAALEACDAAIRRVAGFSILEELGADGSRSRIDDIDVVQPLLFSIGVALAALWRAKGIEPYCVVGHSMGEVAAAYVAGALTLEDASKIICRRSSLLKRIRGQGDMALVELSMAEAEEAVKDHPGLLDIAASNGLRSTVLSGDPIALSHLLTKLENDGIYCRRIKVDVASHSPQVDALRNDLLTALHELQPVPGPVRMQSTVTGKPLDGRELVAEYWWSNLRSPVQFSKVIQTLLDQGCSIFIELSPHPTLLPSIEETARITAHHATMIASMRRQVDEIRHMAEALAVVEALGYPTARVLASQSYGRDIDFNNGPRHVFLGQRVEVSSHPETIFWQSDLSIESIPWLAGHRVDGHIILPGSAFIEAALAAARECIGAGAIVIEDMLLVAPVILPEREKVAIELALTKRNDGTWGFVLSSRNHREKTQWRVHATAQIQSGGACSPPDMAHALVEARGRCSNRMSLQDFVHEQHVRNIDIDPSFETVVDLSNADNEAVVRLQIAEAPFMGQDYLIHPMLLDGGLRATFAISNRDTSRQTRVLSSIRRIRFYQKVSREAWGVCRASVGGTRDIDEAASLVLLNGEGRACFEADGIEARRLSAYADPSVPFSLMTRWDDVPLSAKLETGAAAGSWLILCDEGGMGEALRNRLVANDGDVQCVYRRAARNGLPVGRTEADAGDGEQIATMLQKAFRNEDNPRGIIYLWGMDQESDVSLQSIDAAVDRGCGGTLHVVQGLGRLNTRHKPRMWLVLRGTQMVQQVPREISVEQAPLWGLGRTIAYEAPDLRCTRVDLDPSRPAEEVEMLFTELLADNLEEELALRNDRRFVARLERPTILPAVADRPAVSADATYLITGGLGGLGIFSARCLVSAGARHLVLLGRQGIKTEAQQEAIEALRLAGAKVEIAVADVASSAQLAETFRMIDACMPPLRGILHAAGVLEDGFLATQTVERFRRVFAPKVIGGWNLHQLTEKRILDFFILYSSIAGLLGSPGLGNYVAANTFLDALAHYRNANGLVGTSINWGLFGDLGMAEKAENLGGISRHGIRGFDSDEAEALLLRVLVETRSQVGLVAIDFRQWLQSYPQVAASPRFRDVLQKSTNGSTRNTNAHARDWLDSIAQANPRTRISMVETLVRQHLAEVLRMDAARIHRTQPLRELGVDSLMGMEVRNRLESAIGIRLSATLVYAHPTLGAIAEHILKNLSDKLKDVLQGVEVTAQVSQPEGIEPVATRSTGESSKTGDAQDDILALFDQTIAHLESERDDE